MSLLAWLAVASILLLLAILWGMCRVAARSDAEEAHREIVALLAETAQQKDDDDIARNPDI